MQLKINGLQHIGIPVTDLKRSEVFYEGLGFKNVMSSQFEINNEKGFVSMMQKDALIIEIYQMPPAELEEVKSRKNGHIDHIAFDVDDIDASFTLLKSNGYTILEPIFLNFWSKGCKYFNILGPDGERLEFNQIL
jgi:catechol 2,3-dioxygenase-like lactoylglutathione lyase family enzyme